MSRILPVGLQSHLKQDVITVCRLLKITLDDGRVFGITNLDQHIEYQGVAYSALQGFDTSEISTSAGLTVDNAEADCLLVTTGGITIEDIERGDLDNAKWVMYLINYMKPSDGHLILDSGTLGEITVTDGIVYTPELLSWSMLLRQPIGHVWSRQCRAIFGSPADSQTGCGYDAEALWVSGTVTGTDPEDVLRVFADDSIPLATEPLTAMVRFTSGDNASSRLHKVEAYSDVSGTIVLFEPVKYPIKNGDDFEIRPDCPKTFNACKAYGNLINMKAEPYIPVADGLQSMTPNSQVFGTLNGSRISD